jgi:predicted TIM-barrel fold metal-dependent hydrolase
MPVLDVHVHVGRSHQITPRLTEYLQQNIGKEVLSLLDGITPEEMEQHLSAQGVDRAVLLAEYSPKTTGIIPSEFIADFCHNSDRLIPFGSIDLDSGTDTGTQTEHCVTKLGCRGLKLVPSYTYFYPYDQRMFPAYETAAHLGIPVTFHTGTSLFPGSRIRFAHPLLLDDVAEDFPDLTIVMAHGGRPFWYSEAEWLLRRHKNVYIDISGVPPEQIPQVFPKLEQYADRYLFGSDWPTVPFVAKQIQQVRELPYSSSTLQAILWDNGARLLKLEQ